LIQLFPPDDERLSLETCRGGKINTLKKEKSASSWLKIHKVNWAVNTLKRCLSVSCPLRPTAADFKAASFIPQKIHRFKM
jgi:hypothetical protein